MTRDSSPDARSTRDRVTTGIGPWGQVPQWVLQALAGDCTAIAVYAALATYADRGESCHPAQATIAEMIGVTEDTVSRVIRRLAERGLVEVTPRLVKGRKVGNDYHLAMVQTGTARGAGSVDATEPRGDAVPRTARGRGLLEQTNEQTNDARLDSPREVAQSLLVAQFDNWWRVYPRKADKARAREKYLARRRAGASEDDLLAAASKYRAEREGEPVEFTKHAATFLARDDGPWREALERSRQPQRDDGPVDLTEMQRRMNEEHWRREQEAGR